MRLLSAEASVPLQSMRKGTVDTRDWQVVALKTEGVQPGYRVADPEGHLWSVGSYDPWEADPA